DELEQDPNVNVAYFRDRTKEWVSVSGIAQISQDRAKIRELYKPDWRMWFEEIDDVRDGGPDDPRLALLQVTAESVVYMKKDKSAPVVLFELAKGMVTGEQPDVAEMRKLSGSEVRQPAGGVHAKAVRTTVWTGCLRGPSASWDGR